MDEFKKLEPLFTHPEYRRNRRGVLEIYNWLEKRGQSRKNILEVLMKDLKIRAFNNRNHYENPLKYDDIEGCNCD